MKVKKGTENSKFILETEKGSIYKSVTSYDYKNDIVQYVVDNNNADYGNRFFSLEEALIFFNENI